MYKAIAFDWGGVLVPSKPIVPGIAKIINVPEQQLYEFYLQHNYKAGVDNMPYEELWALVLTGLNKSEYVDQVLAHIKQQQTSETDPRLLELISLLRDMNYKVGMLSNNTKEIGQRIRDEGLAEYFNSFLISGEIGFQKPDPKAFSKLFESLEVSAEETVFIDDSTSSLSTASQIGYTPILYAGYEDLIEQLQDLEIIN